MRRLCHIQLVILCFGGSLDIATELAAPMIATDAAENDESLRRTIPIADATAVSDGDDCTDEGGATVDSAEANNRSSRRPLVNSPASMMVAVSRLGHIGDVTDAVES